MLRDKKRMRVRMNEGGGVDRFIFAWVKEGGRMASFLCSIICGPGLVISWL